MKNLSLKLTLLGCVSVCLAGMAQAQDVQDELAFGDCGLDGLPVCWEPDVGFIDTPNISDVNCGSSPRTITLTVKNYEAVGIILYDPVLIAKDSFPEDLLTIDGGTCIFDNGTKLPGGKTCTVDLILTPPACPPSGPIFGFVDRVLRIGVDTLQVFAFANLNEFHFTTLGAAGGDTGFAILGNDVHNRDGVAYVEGSVGHTQVTSPGTIDLNFNVIDGMLYTSSTAQAVLDAQDAFSAAWNTFNTMRETYGCTPRGNLDDGDRINGGLYCLQNRVCTNPTDFRTCHDVEPNIDGYITLEGGPASFFVFYVGSDESDCWDLASPLPATPLIRRPCSLNVHPATYFEYEREANPNNVFWIVGNGFVDIFQAAALDGIVLAAGGPIFSDGPGNNPGTVHGRLWSNYSIYLYSNSVSVPEQSEFDFDFGFGFEGCDFCYDWNFDGDNANVAYSE